MRVAEVWRLDQCIYNALSVSALSVHLADIHVVRERGARLLLLCVASQADGAARGWECCASQAPGLSVWFGPLFCTWGNI